MLSRLKYLEKRDVIYLLTLTVIVLVFVVFITWWVVIDRSPDVQSRYHGQKLKLVIDHDGGADDAMAVFLALLYEKYFNGPQVIALTTTHGNVNESQVFINSQRFLDLARRRDVDIYRGAVKSILETPESDFFFGHDGLGDNPDLGGFKEIKAANEHAAFGLIELSKKYEGELVVIAIGPQTNIALAQRLDPSFIGRLNQLYVGAGHIPSEQFHEPEFNALMDVEAYRIVTDVATVDKVTLVPFSQVETTIVATRYWREHVLGRIPTKIIQNLNKYERISLPTSEYWTLLDPAVSAIMLNRDVAQMYKTARNSIIICGKERGINTNSFTSNEPNVRVMYAGNVEVYKKLLVDVFSAELASC